MLPLKHNVRHGLVFGCQLFVHFPQAGVGEDVQVNIFPGYQVDAGRKFSHSVEGKAVFAQAGSRPGLRLFLYGLGSGDGVGGMIFVGFGGGRS